MNAIYKALHVRVCGDFKYEILTRLQTTCVAPKALCYASLIFMPTKLSEILDGNLVQNNQELLQDHPRANSINPQVQCIVIYDIAAVCRVHAW